MQSAVDKSTPRQALLLTSAAQVMIGVFVKYLTQSDLSIWSQILLRNSIAGGLALIIVPTAIPAFIALDIQEKKHVLIRSLFYIGAIYFFTLSLKTTSISNTNFVMAFPFIALLGWVLFKDPISKIQTSLLFIAVAGIAIISGVTLSTFKFGEGEAYALLSSALFAAMFLWTRKIKDSLTNNEFSALTQVIIIPILLITVLVIPGPGDIISNTSLKAFAFASGAAVFILLSLLFKTSAAARTDAATSNLWLSTTPLFSIFASIIFFSTTPGMRDLIGGTLILLSSVAFVLTEKSKPQQSQLKLR